MMHKLRISRIQIAMRATGVSDEALHEIAHRLRITREALGFTQLEFAGRAGIAGNTYNQYEKGKKLPSIKNAVALCEAHSLTLDWIFRNDPGNLPYRLADAIKAIRAPRA